MSEAPAAPGHEEGASFVDNDTGETAQGHLALETLLSNLPGMAYRCLNNQDWTMEFVSDWCLPLTGYAREALLGNRHVAFGDLIHPDDRDEVWAKVQAALAEQRPFQSIYRITTASGQEKWVWEQGRAVRSEQGDVVAIEGLILDVTDQRRLEERTASSERKFRALYENANDAIFLMRGDTFIDCNPKTEEIFGCAKDYILRRKPYEFSPIQQADGRDSKTAALEKIDGALAGVSQVFQWKHQKLDGTPFDAEVSLSRVDIDGEPVVLAIVRDVTERVQAYQLLEQRVAERTAELRATEARYQDLFERSRDAIFITSEGQFLEVNQAAVDLLKVPREEIIGAPVDAYLSEASDRARMQEALASGSGAVKDFEVQLRRADGEVLDCLLTGHRYSDLDKGVMGFEGIVRDITEWKRTEEDLFLQTRESAVLNERNRMAREIHDTLAQGLTGIVLQLEAAEQTQPSRPEVAQEHVSRAKALARESLQEARRSVWDLVPQALQEGDLLHALEEQIRGFAARGSEDAQLAVQGKPRPLPVDAQVDLLRIAQEALLNARKYADAQSVKVEVEYSDDFVRLAVIDDGRGFSVDEQTGPRGQEWQGGFGLTAMRQRAQRLAGRLVVDTTPGNGTRIEVMIPWPLLGTG